MTKVAVEFGLSDRGLAKLIADVDALSLGQRVRFDVGTDDRTNRSRAIEVHLVD